MADIGSVGLVSGFGMKNSEISAVRIANFTKPTTLDGGRVFGIGGTAILTKCELLVSANVPRSVTIKSETKVQRDVVQLYRRIGCVVYIVGANLRPQVGQTPGIPDLEVWHRGRRLFWKHESKTPTGEPSIAQREYGELAQWCGVPVVTGGLHEALEFLRERGLSA